MSRHTLFLLVLMASLLVSIGLAYAEETVKVSLSSNSLESEAGSLAITNLTLKNPTNSSFTFALSVRGSNPEYLVVDKSISLEANSTKIAAVIFNPKDDIGRFPLTINGEVINNQNINFSFPISLWAKHPDKYIVKEFSHLVEGNKITSKITLKPHDRLLTEITFDIIDINGKSVKTASLSQEIEKETALQQSLDTSDLQTGKYTLRASVKGTNISKEAVFDIGLSRNIRTERSVTSGLFFNEVKINLYNYGNLIENDYKLYEEIGKNRKVTLVTNATDIIKSGDTLKYEFTIEKIRPGEVATIIYRLEYIQDVATALFALIVLSGLGVFAYTKSQKPKVKKRFVKQSHDSYSVMIEIRNPRFSKIKSGVVREVIGPTGKVNRREASGVPPQIKDSQLGTELVWKIPEMVGSQTITLQYMVDYRKDSGRLKLSPATFSYTTSRNRQGFSFSNELVL